ncbi:hypothetical protein [Gordonia sihwensis]|uniref:hypothetical protein n=1 Tax=Gordonia sihwensis TaxID=173559 RepID=UPI0005EEFDA9|nr:hypothetical protein [Gordonia sihwensis]KJR09346.1 hypothetical protein UG54_04750 [Gordonia sihwensis]
MRGSTLLGTFARVLGFSLLAGIVFPVFIIVYLVVPSPPLWLLIVGVIGLVDVVVIATFIALKLHRSHPPVQELDEPGVPGIGTIAHVADTATEIGGHRVMAFDWRSAGRGSTSSPPNSRPWYRPFRWARSAAGWSA